MKINKIISFVLITFVVFFYKSLPVEAAASQLDGRFIAPATIDLTTKVKNTLPTTNGGSGINAYNVGDTLYSSATNTLSTLSGNTSIIPKMLMQTGTGTTSTAPSWTTPTLNNILSPTTSFSFANQNITGVNSINAGSVFIPALTGVLKGSFGIPTLLVSSGLNQPYGIVLDSSGNIYITDAGNNAIKKYDSTGANLYSVSGLNIPRGLTLDSSGNIYVCDSGNNAVKKYSSTGTLISTLITGLNNPYSVALDSSGNIYIANLGASNILKYSSTGTLISTLVPSITNPRGLTLDSSGNIYVTAGNTVIKFSNTGTLISTLITGLSTPYGIKLDTLGNIYVADTKNNTIKKYDSTGVLLSALPTNTGNFADVAIDSNYIYATDISFNYIKRYDINTRGLIQSSATFNDLAPPTSQVNFGSQNLGTIGNVNAQSITSTGNITATGNVNAQNVTTTGLITTPSLTATGTINAQNITGTGLGGVLRSSSTIANTLVSTGLSSPNAVCADSAGNLYIADTGNNAIKKMDTSGVVTTLVSGVSSPKSIIVDSAGNLYFTDVSNLKKRDTSGTVTTLISSLSAPLGIAIDSIGNLYVGSNTTIKKYDTTATTTIFASGFSNIYGVGIDSSNNIYALDYGNGQIKKYNNAGTLLTTLNASGGFGVSLYSGGVQSMTVDSLGFIYTNEVSASSGSFWIKKIDINNNGNYFSNPKLVGNSGLAISPDGKTMYIADTTNSSIKSIDLQGTIKSGATFNDLAPPTFDLTFNARNLGNIANVTAQNLISTGNITASGNVNAQNIIASGTISSANANVTGIGGVLKSSSTIPTTLVSTGLSSPNAVCADSAGNLYIADTGNNAIKKRDISGTVTTLTSGLSSPNSIIVDSAGNLYFTDVSTLKKRDTSGTVTTLISGLSSPKGIAIDSIGNLYVGSNTTIKKYDTTAVITTFASGFSAIYGVGIDSSNNIYALDYNNSQIKKYNNAGTLITTLNATTSGAFMGAVQSITVDSLGFIYSNEVYYGSWIKKFDINNNGGYLSNLNLGGTSGLAISPDGKTMYIADTTNSSIKSIDLQGTIKSGASFNDLVPPTFDLNFANRNLGTIGTVNAQNVTLSSGLTSQSVSATQGLYTKAFSTGINAQTTTYSITSTDFTIIGDTTSASFTFTLPTAVNIAGRIYLIKKKVAINTLTIATSLSQTIDGATTQALTAQYSSLMLQSDGANWIILSRI